jgi:hypothetical protein
MNPNKTQGELIGSALSKGRSISRKTPRLTRKNNRVSSQPDFVKTKFPARIFFSNSLIMGTDNSSHRNMILNQKVIEPGTWKRSKSK